MIEKYSYHRDSIFVSCIPHVCHVQNHFIITGRSSRCRATYAAFTKKPHDFRPRQTGGSRSWRVEFSREAVGVRLQGTTTRKQQHYNIYGSRLGNSSSKMEHRTARAWVLSTWNDTLAVARASCNSTTTQGLRRDKCCSERIRHAKRVLKVGSDNTDETLRNILPVD